MKAIIFLENPKKLDRSIGKNFASSLLANKIRANTYFMDSKKGLEIAASYGIMDLPAMVMLSEDGTSRGFWQGRLPSESEINNAVGYI